MRADIVGCGRCGGYHPQVELQPFTRPIFYRSTLVATHFAACPTMQEPILVTPLRRTPKR